MSFGAQWIEMTFGTGRRETEPPKTGAPSFPRCEPWCWIYLPLQIYPKCRLIFHTWSIWGYYCPFFRSTDTCRLPSFCAMKHSASQERQDVSEILEAGLSFTKHGRIPISWIVPHICSKSEVEPCTLLATAGNKMWICTIQRQISTREVQKGHKAALGIGVLCWTCTFDLLGVFWWLE